MCEQLLAEQEKPENLERIRDTGLRLVTKPTELNR
jgi:hypothetical protein